MKRESVAWLMILLMTLSTFGYALFLTSPSKTNESEELVAKGFTVVEVYNLTNDTLREIFEELPKEYETNFGERQLVVIYVNDQNISGVKIRSGLGEEFISEFDLNEIRKAICELLLYKSVSCLNFTG